MARSGNRLTIDYLSKPNDVRRLIKEFYTIVQYKGFEEVVLDLRNVSRAYPNTCVPVVGVVNYYRSQNIDIKMLNLPPFLKRAHFDNPMPASKATVASSNGVLSKVWSFADAQGVSALTKAYVDALSEKVECSKGVLEAFEWCINELMDNVLQHSGEKEGFVMVAIHTEQKRAAICLTDTGIGIYRSLRDSVYKPRNSVDAITMAVKEGVTRNSKEHQGNGLWGLLEIVSENKGRLNIISGNGSVLYRSDGQVDTYDKVPYLDQIHQCTTIDFQINTDAVIDISKALGGHQPLNLRLEALEANAGEHYVIVKDHSHGTGTRKAAVELRNFIVNLINQGASKVILDFQGIGVISSSFADEFIGKLVVRFGFFNFQQIISLRGMTETVQVILHRSVAQRMIEGLQQHTSEKEEEET